jgi:radical SAM superfamily enzyme YgiQ (UPF0313 family)
MPKILFIQPTQYASDGKLCKQKRINLPGLAFPLLAAYTPPNWEVEIQIEVVDDINFDTDADIIGIGTMGHAMFRGIEIADEFRKRGKKVIMGGYMSSIMSSEAINYADSIVIGDAEQAYPALLKDFEEKGELKPFYNMPVKNLDGLPVPRYDLLLEKPITNMLPVQAGRGCPYSCTFCSIACLYRGKYLFRPVDEVVRDIKEVKRLGFNRFYLIDDNIASNPKYLRELCEKITPLKMHWASQCTLRLARNPELLDLVVRSGCDLMSFGLESINQAALDSVNKAWLKAADHEKNLSALSRAGITLSTEMIVGTDEDTEESIRATYDFINKTRIAIPRFYIMTPVPGTQLYENYKEEGRLITEDLRQFDGTRCVYHPKKMSAEQLTELFWWLNRKVFSYYSIFHRTLFNPALWRNPRNLLLALAVNFHYRQYIKRKTVPNIY